MFFVSARTPSRTDRRTCDRSSVQRRNGRRENANGGGKYRATAGEGEGKDVDSEGVEKEEGNGKKIGKARETENQKQADSEGGQQCLQVNQVYAD